VPTERNLTVTRQDDLIERLRAELGDEPSTRQVAMFGARCLIVDDKMIACALKQGDLLVRVPADRHEELTRRPGAAEAQMGAGRTMGPGWITVTAASVVDDGDLTFWIETALEHNRTIRQKPEPRSRARGTDRQRRSTA
jgi:TfoX/Sxy family transcriptional regulator of competence genes